MNDKINLSTVLATLTEPWAEGVVANCNGFQLMVVKACGEYPWHRHAHTDDLFLVLHGQLTIELRDRAVHLGSGDVFVVPKGLEHRVVAEHEAHVLLMEPPRTSERDAVRV